MLTNKQKAYLRGLANELKPVTQIGKDGVTFNVVETVDNALEARELIKLSVLKTCPQEMNEVAIELASETHSDVVQIIGRVIVLFRINKKKGKIELPR